MRTSIKIALFVVFFMAVAGIGVALYFYNLKPANLQNVAPVYTLMAADLQKAFEKDEALATEKYVNKVVDITGMVITVLSGEGNTYNISLNTGNRMTFIICTLQKTEGVRMPNVGENITIRGTCSGYLMDILMNNCVIVKK
jgi:hypothetical protein